MRVSLCLAVFFASLDEGGGSGARKCFFESNTPPSPAARVLDSIAARPRPARRASHSHRNGFAARGCSASRSARCDSAPRLSRPQAARTFRLRPAHALWSYLSAENTLCPSAPPRYLMYLLSHVRNILSSPLPACGTSRLRAPPHHRRRAGAPYLIIYNISRPVFHSHLLCAGSPNFVVYSSTYATRFKCSLASSRFSLHKMAYFHLIFLLKYYMCCTVYIEWLRLKCYICFVIYTRRCDVRF